MTQLPDVIADLTAEGDSVDQMVADLRPDQWTIPTPAPGWTIGHQIAHLTATFRMAGMAAADPTANLPLTVPAVIVHGDLDAEVPVEIGVDFVAASGSAGDDVRLVRLSDVEHYALIDPQSSVWPQIIGAVDALC